MLRPEIPLDAALDRHFAPGYRQRTDGEWTDRAQFAAHIAHLREIVADGRISVHEELTSGSTYAERHTIELTKRDGTVVVMEVYAFGEHAADGRFARIEEVTLMLLGHESDRNLGSSR